MDIHIGEKIKARAKELKIGPSELGLLINTSKQNIVGIYKRKSIDSEQLWFVSQALKFNFFALYELPGLDKGHIKIMQKELDAVKSENKKLKKELQNLQEKNALLIRLNELLEMKK